MAQEEFVDYAKRKKTTGKLLVIFIVMIVLLTFFSNTINNFTLPNVTVEEPSSGALIKEISGEGTIEAKSVIEEYADANLKVLDVKVEAGDTVKKGQPIMTLDIDDLQSSLQDENARYEQQQIALDKLKDGSSRLNYDNSVRSSLDNLEKQKQNYQNIKTLYESGYETLTNMKNAEAAVKDAEAGYNSAVQAKDGFIRNNQRDIKSAELNLEIEARKIEALQKQVANGGIYTAQSDGVVTELSFPAGTMTNGSKPLFKLAATSGGFEFTVSVDRDLVGYVKLGDKVDVTVTSLGDKPVQGKISQIKEDIQNGDNKELQIDINDKELQGGENAQVIISKKTKQYHVLVPNSAVHSDSYGYFVYVVRKNEAPLGTDDYVQKVNVTVEDSDSTKSAIINGILPVDKVVTQSTKALDDGDRVVVE